MSGIAHPACPPDHPPARHPLPLETAAALAALAPPEPALLGPVAPGALTLIRGPRGVGKSWLALAIARAIAGAGELLGWKARQASVLYIEAAMSDTALGQRLRTLGPVPEALRVGRSFPLEAGPDDDGRLTMLGPSKVLMLDGVARLVNRGRGRAGQRWRDLDESLRRLREAGHAIVLVEHGRRALIEDLADTILVLKPQTGEADVAFSVAATSRHALARQDRRFGVELGLDGTAAWRRHDAVDPALAAVAGQADRPVREGATALGLSTATYWRRLQAAKAEGLVDDKPRETNETDQALRRASDQVLQRTLEKRLKAPRGSAPRPGPAILAAVSDGDILAELAHRHPQRADRLRVHFAQPAPAA